MREYFWIQRWGFCLVGLCGFIWIFFFFRHCLINMWDSIWHLTLPRVQPEWPSSYHMAKTTQQVRDAATTQTYKPLLVPPGHSDPAEPNHPATTYSYHHHICKCFANNVAGVETTPASCEGYLHQHSDLVNVSINIQSPILAPIAWVES